MRRNEPSPALIAKIEIALLKVPANKNLPVGSAARLVIWPSQVFSDRIGKRGIQKWRAPYFTKSAGLTFDGNGGNSQVLGGGDI